MFIYTQILKEMIFKKTFLLSDFSIEAEFYLSTNSFKTINFPLITWAYQYQKVLRHYLASIIRILTAIVRCWPLLTAGVHC